MFVVASMSLFLFAASDSKVTARRCGRPVGVTTPQHGLY